MWTPAASTLMRVSALLPVAGALLLGTPARAHLPGEGGIDVTEEYSSVFFGIEGVGFRRGAVPGGYFSLRFAGQWAPRPYLGLGLTAPVHWVWAEGAAGQRGIGEPTGFVRIRLWRHPRIPFAVGTGISYAFPSIHHQTEAGTSYGELTPFLRLGGTWRALGYAAQLAPLVALGSGGTPTFVNPHSTLELRARGELSWAASPRLTASLGFETALVLAAEERGAMVRILLPGLALRPAPGWQFLLLGELPVGGSRRLDWRILTGVSVDARAWAAPPH
ncbi:MAG: hypothetical protein IT371_28720 [Deltaproteobacteria bacterium]|nr:hypothetical protein [Deltaproteobacteria bacterium]